ncbi:MAG: RNase adapter RapZ [Betaproteobacteria bacterium]|nr:RNase adapter RapZ [Betaproteobacteria bacterium]
MTASKYLPLEVVLITGLSGSGKSVALAVLEDAGYYCVDNFPGKLFNSLVDVLAQAGQTRVALTMDARSGDDLADFPNHIESLRAHGVQFKILYCDAKDDTLIKRYSETRRRHPLSDGRRTLVECIARERELLADVAALADHIDTSDLSPNVLRAWVKDFVAAPRGGLILLFESFGFKYGIPLDADMVFDVRNLPNPHYDPALRPLTGQDAPVIGFMQGIPEAQRMLEDIRMFIANWLPSYVRDNRSYLTVAIGCTGGRHRSVYFVESLAQAFRPSVQVVLARHRGLGQRAS